MSGPVRVEYTDSNYILHDGPEFRVELVYTREGGAMAVSTQAAIERIPRPRRYEICLLSLAMHFGDWFGVIARLELRSRAPPCPRPRALTLRAFLPGLSGLYVAYGCAVDCYLAYAGTSPVGSVPRLSKSRL